MNFEPGDRLTPWLHPHAESRFSPIAGMGVFAVRAIARGTVVCRWGGVIYTRADLQAGRADPETVAVVEEGLWLGDPAGAPLAVDYAINHSCDPNLWMVDAITLAARRDIPPGEEITADYALWLYGVEWALDPCRCGSRLCRGRVTSEDWRRPDLQARYAGHFTPLLNKLILERRL